ncbi:bifunctional DedA family/phosphatase PAP2 family protein [Lysobacter niastensis]|uniref:Bifunctional DedA family/phosphatase PAP2 family protein n=1 Tax=Lysobacter niastensis TaxID=380629 RepID=A0ABS0B5S3_9GAMM|nr:bifunctional DedA family/phosphatase PAP2 family protein [Lysobacter niastensis]MBF6024218.1 bifunctional DedA family/phosphatase PAP2 family protein [Lysobacter niastensis]
MESAWLESATAWISAHPTAAGALIFLIAFCDALVILGIVVPALPLLFAVGALIGLGHINGPYALVCATLGAFIGDGLSYWIGRRWGPQLRSRWPFSRYPQWLDSGESMFRRHGTKSIVIARFVGAVRPFVPAIAGMLHMPLRRYALPSLAACVFWSASFLAPGWVLGASYNAVAAVADRLAIVLGTLVVAIALVWACVLYTWRWFAAHADNLLSRALRWTRAHPHLGRYAAALIDPNRPESPSLVMLAACLLAISWAWFTLLASLLASGGPLAIDHRVHEFMWNLRNPLADRLMAALASLGDAAVLGPAAVVALGYLLWRRRWMAATHWVAALVFGLALTALLEQAIDMPRPPTAPEGFGFPSVAVTMSTIVFGFFAVLIARELPGRTRVWPYLVAGIVTTLLGFARLYLGAHWPSDLVGGTLFGILWLLMLGIAYRRHVARSFWMRPLAILFYGTFALAAVWHAPRSVDALLAKFEAATPTTVLAHEQWWQRDWATLPDQRNERDIRRRWPLDVQVAGPLEPLRARLVTQGWRVQPQADWVATVGLLDEDTPAREQPVLPATLDAHAETLLLLHDGRDGNEQYALRLWQAPAILNDGTPLWVGTTQTLRLSRPLDSAVLWLPEKDDGHAHALVKSALKDFESVESPHPASGAPVLRLRTAPATSGQ